VIVVSSDMLPFRFGVSVQPPELARTTKVP
jgi:hypothetical protein